MAQRQPSCNLQKHIILPRRGRPLAQNNLRTDRFGLAQALAVNDEAGIRTGQDDKLSAGGLSDSVSDWDSEVNNSS